MVNAIGASTPYDNCFTTFSSGEENYQSIFYVNDVHGQLPSMDKLNNASTQFDSFTSEKDNIDAFKFSAGDIFIGSNKKVNEASAQFLNATGIQATAIGNHEFDIGATILSSLLAGVRAVKVAANAFIPQTNPLKGQVIKSTVMTGKSGEKYGIIGAQSPTLIERMKDKTLFEGIKISGGKEAYAELQKESDKLQKQGINKVIMLSHSGYEEEKAFAKNVSGVDVIIGGHSHDLVLDIKKGENLQYSPKGEPVVITQAGRDGKNFGILNVQYDEKGIITKAQNNVFDTSKFAKGMLMTTTTNVVLGKSPVLGKIKSIEPLTTRMNVEENPYTDVFMDVVRESTGADIVLMNSANFRGGLEVGEFTERDINGIFPFKNSMCIVELSEKNLIDALNHGGTSLTKPDLKPSIIQVSGMTYTMSQDGKVTQASILNKDGTKHKIDVNNPSTEKTYKAAYDDYLLKGGDGFTSLSDAKVLKMFNYDKDQITIDYFKNRKSNEPIEIKRDGRIKVQ